MAARRHKWGDIHAVGDQPSGIDEFAEAVHRRQSVPHRKLHDAIAIADSQWINDDDQRLRLGRDHAREGAVELLRLADPLKVKRDPELAGGRLQDAHIVRACGVDRVPDHGHPGRCRNHLAQ
jgi:hypothetical protein